MTNNTKIQISTIDAPKWSITPEISVILLILTIIIGTGVYLIIKQRNKMKEDLLEANRLKQNLLEANKVIEENQKSIQRLNSRLGNLEDKTNKK